MFRTNFAGLTGIEAGDSPWDDDGAAFDRNVRIADRLLRLGARDHRHDAHAALADPATAPSLAFVIGGGAIPPETDLHVGFALLDDQGGETLISPVASGTTPPGLAAPAAPAGTMDDTGGDLQPGFYSYVLTATDGNGGETLASDALVLERTVGAASGRALLTGLQTDAVSVGGSGWRLYRAVNGGQLGFVAAGATETFTDDAAVCADPQLAPPDDNSTTLATRADVVVPAAAASAATGYRLYASTDPAFPSPSLVGEFPAASAGATHSIVNLGLQSGGPVPVSQSVGGAAKVLAVRDIDWTGYVGGGSGSGGGGGSGGALTPLASHAFGDGPTLTFDMLASAGIVWDDPDGHAFALAVREAVRRPTGNWGWEDFYNGYGGATHYEGNVGAFQVVAGDVRPQTANNDLLVNMNPNGDFGAGIPGSVLEGACELDYAIVGADWTRFAVGLGLRALPNGNALVLYIDRASGELRLAHLTGSPWTVTDLVVKGAADGWTPPAVGDNGSLYVRRIGDRVECLEYRGGRPENFTFVYEVPSEFGFSGQLTVGMFGARVGNPDQLSFTYFNLVTLGIARELVAYAFQQVSGQPASSRTPLELEVLVRSDTAPVVGPERTNMQTAADYTAPGQGYTQTDNYPWFWRDPRGFVVLGGKLSPQVATAGAAFQVPYAPAYLTRLTVLDEAGAPQTFEIDPATLTATRLTTGTSPIWLDGLEYRLPGATT